MAELIEVAFKGNRKEFFQWDGNGEITAKTAVIVEADRGEDFGYVHAIGELAATRCGGCAHGCGTAEPPRKILRRATPDDERRAGELRVQDEDVRRRAMEKVKSHGLVMKLTDAEWQHDKRKLTIYFTADKRVDFRTLVRDLAATFRARIELKQIGVRDEAKRLSGIGRCGREYCSASWLPELRPVNLQIAKDQRLSLNPSQISGACGRLMCCLRYEHEFYVSSRKRFPKEGRTLATTRGEERVLATDIFRDRVTLQGTDGETRIVTLVDLKRELEGPGELPDAADDDAAIMATVVSDELITDEYVPDESLPDETGGSPATRREAPDGGGDAAERSRRRGRRGGHRPRGDRDNRPRGDDSGTP